MSVDFKSKVTVVSTKTTPRLRLNLTAAGDFKRGDTVLQCSEHEIQESRTWRTVQIGVGRHVKNEFLAYVDHSCEPNTLFDVDNLSLDAVRDISSGELITFFYPGSEVELAQEFQCKCGADSCLGRIKGGFYLTGDEMKRALEQGHCTGFMKRHLERLLES